MKKSIYYSLDRIKQTCSDINIIVGQRGNGKSYAVYKEALKLYKETGKRFCLIRRWKSDLVGYQTEQLFLPLQKEIEAIFGKGHTVLYFRHKFYLVNEAGEKLDFFGYTLSLSEASHTKSIPYVNVGMIVFDEFIQISGEATLRDEKMKYETVVSTICRDKTDIVFYLLANTVSKFSWVFLYYGILIDSVKQGEIVTKELPLDSGDILRVSLEYCAENKSIGDKTAKYTTSKMTSKGLWEIPETDSIPTVKGEIVKDRLLFTVYDYEADIIIGCFLRTSKWSTLEINEDTLLYYEKTHIRQFLILKTINYKSSYFHLTNQKSLNYHTFNDFQMMLQEIKETTDIDFERELFMGRIFSDNMFTADYFNHCWTVYNRVSPRMML